MDHTHIVRAGDLAGYADTRESEAVIPELLYQLVKASVPNASKCRIPYGDAINQPGWDGIVETTTAFREFVPEGRSYWEVGTGAKPNDKATDVFNKRTKKLSISDRSVASFVFVTPRLWDEPKQTQWAKERKNHGWKAICIIDNGKLADWLREFPSVGRWMAKTIGLSSSLGGFSTPKEHWDTIIASTPSSDPPLPPKLFAEGRSNACTALHALFDGQSQRLLLFAESSHDVADFVAAYLATLDEENARNYGNRCLYVHEEEAWLSIVEVQSSHVLVADPRLSLETPEKADHMTIAIKKGHGVIVPLCGAWSVGEQHEIIRLHSPSRFQIETILKEAGYPEVRSRELGSIGGGMISALRRHLQGLGAVPPYATWPNARLIAQAGLAGQWDGNNPADKATLESLLGKEYGEWIETLRPDALRLDAPLMHVDEKWRFVARGEAWNALGNRITDEDLDRLCETAVIVLGERAPAFDLPKEERWAANMHGKKLKHSNFLREGLAETLALIGSRPDALSSCSLHKPQNTAAHTVHGLLYDANWDRWASLDSLLPLLAEADPNSFLRVVEAALEDLDTSPLHKLFAQESNGSVGGQNYMSGLLWALETLAWHHDFLTRVAVILADLASIDPGGNWSNRPLGSLVNIFLPWHVQTCASLEKRKTAVQTVLREQPTIGWALVLGLLPHNHGVTYGCHRPTWRNYIPSDWADSVLVSEYWEQITMYTELAVSLAKTNMEQVGELIDRLHDLPTPARENLLEHLGSEELVTLPEDERLKIWEKLGDLIRKHRRFADAGWAMSKDAIAKVEHVANTLAPEAPKLKYRYLFSGRNFDLFDEDGNYDEQQKRLDTAKQNAVQTILDAGGVHAVLAFARSVAVPYDVGHFLGGIKNDEIETEILPALLDADDNNEKLVVYGFVRGRFGKLSWTWVDRVLGNNWSDIQKSTFLTLLSFEKTTWNRVNQHLDHEKEKLYWLKVVVNPVGPDRDLTLAIAKLIEYGRAEDAVLCVHLTIHDAKHFKADLAIRTLSAVLEIPDAADRLARSGLGHKYVVDIITRLQQSPSVEPDDLFKIEWNFLPWLDRFSSGGSPVTLDKCLSSDPAFFAKVIALVFRSDHEDKNSVAPSEERRNLARNAYQLLEEWKTCPGILADGVFDPDAFKQWLEVATRMTKETGHSKIAQQRIGHVLAHAPLDPNGLWIHREVASALNKKDASAMRLGFTIELFNQRGAYIISNGKEEQALAQRNREKADAIEQKGYSRLATEMRSLAERYERDAERDLRRDPLDD